MKLRDCPDCSTHMQPFWLPATRLGDEVELDRCTDCGGVWFDAGELSDATGKAVRASQEKTRRNCPACAAFLVQGKLSDGPDVETCPSCRGTFLEARDLDLLGRKQKRTHRAPGSTGFVCDRCGARTPFSEAHATLTGLECASCHGARGQDVAPVPEAREEARSAFDRFLGWLKGE
jgi:Zn-finger nucleic acid-binding protein